jgi:hypothetical protein
LFLLLLANGVLLAATAALWTAGEARWYPPAALRPEPASLAPATIDIRHAEFGTLPESLQRPLFSPTRSPVPETADGATPMDDFDPVLLGIFEANGAAQGVIVRVEGKVYRLAIGEALGSWTLHGMDDQGGAIFKRAQEQVQVQLRHLPQPPPPRAAPPVPGRAAPAPRGRATPRAPSEGPPAAPRPAPSTDSGQPTLAERIAERRRATHSTTTDPKNQNASIRTS